MPVEAYVTEAIEKYQFTSASPEVSSSSSKPVYFSPLRYKAFHTCNTVQVTLALPLPS